MPMMLFKRCGLARGICSIGAVSRSVILCAALLVWMGAADLLAQDTVYVKMDNAKVRVGTSLSSEVVASLEKGTALRVLATESGRHKVALPGGREGYISRLHVTTTAPTSGRGGVLSGLGGSSGVQADERESVSSIRGLNPAVKEMAEDQKMSEQYVKWVESMESLSASIKDSEVDAFLKAEKIGF
jgi:uncharacterized protein YgiM (DUF1202 family)